jgi:outer membrane usher protein FimD/PapC
MVSRNGQAQAKRVYANYPAFEIGEVQFNRGQANLEVIVQDLAGNSRSALVRIIVE